MHFSVFKLKLQISILKYCFSTIFPQIKGIITHVLLTTTICRPESNFLRRQVDRPADTLGLRTKLKQSASRCERSEQLATVVPQATSTHLNHWAAPKLQVQTALPRGGGEGGWVFPSPNPKPGLGTFVCASVDPIHKGARYLRLELWPSGVVRLIRANLKRPYSSQPHRGVQSTRVALRSTSINCSPLSRLTRKSQCKHCVAEMSDFLVSFPHQLDSSKFKFSVPLAQSLAALGLFQNLPACWIPLSPKINPTCPEPCGPGTFPKLPCFPWIHPSLIPLSFMLFTYAFYISFYLLHYAAVRGFCCLCLDNWAESAFRGLKLLALCSRCAVDRVTTVVG